MALVDTLRSGVATVNNTTISLQGTVLHAAWIRQNTFGTSIFGRRISGTDIYSEDPLSPGIAVPRQAIIELQQQIREAAGRKVITFAHLIFLVPLTLDLPQPSPQRKNPVDPRDVMILPDGSASAIVDIRGFMDATTDYPMFVEVWLGTVSERAGTLL